MTRFLVLVVVTSACRQSDPAIVCDTSCDTDPAISLEQACGDGQMGRSGFVPLPTSVLEYWESRPGSNHFVVVGRRREAPVLVPPMVPTGLGEPVFLECIETAQVEVLDGLGSVYENELDLTGFTGRGFWADLDGHPVEHDQVRVDYFFEEPLRLPERDAPHLFIFVVLPDGTNLLRWSAEVSDGLVSGDYTTSGDSQSVDAFRTPSAE